VETFDIAAEEKSWQAYQESNPSAVSWPMIALIGLAVELLLVGVVIVSRRRKRR
jgi:LPXTG-motif cell wall-anchored protein